MPAHFSSVYSPIADAGTPGQIQRVGRLLASQMNSAGIGPGAEKTGYIPKRVLKKNLKFLINMAIFFSTYKKKSLFFLI